MDRRGPKSATEGRRTAEASARDAAAVAAARGGFASWLRAGRVARQLTVEDVARVTRIQHRALERLESGQFDELPADVFVRGFIRNYARCVGLDVEEALARYTECGLAPSPVSSPQAQALLDAMSTLAPDSARSASPKILRARSSAAMPVATPRTTGSYPVVTVEEIAAAASGAMPIALEPVAEVEAPPVAAPQAIMPIPAMPIVVAAPIPVPAVEVAAVAAPVEMVAAPVETVAAPVEAVAAPGRGKGRRRKDAAAEPTQSGRRNRRGRKGTTPVAAAPTAAEPVTAAPVVAAPIAVAPVVAAPIAVAPVTSAPIAAAPVVAAPISIEVVAAPAELPSIVTSSHDDDELEIELVVGAEVSAPVATAPQISTITQPIEVVSVRAPARPRVSAQVSSPALVLVIDDADPEQAEREREEREQVKEPARRSFLPPILMDDERSGRQGGLTLAVIILLIVATLTLSYLMRRPSSSGEGVTERAIPTRTIA
jgi:hypothetical protein